MTNAGVFQLVSNDGQTDALLMNPAALENRLKRIATQREQQGLDPVPTRRDVQATHILYVTAHFKPFAQIVSEYTTMQSTSGAQRLGSEVRFEVQQYGDFFSDMYLSVLLDQPTLTSTASTPEDTPQMAWCNYIGERLIKKASFSIVNNLIDEYTSASVHTYRKTKVGADEIVGWKDMMGQERPHVGYGQNPDWVGSGVAGTDSRVKYDVCNGWQTPSAQKSGQVRLLIPMLFWMRDVRLAVPSVALPYGQRTLAVELENSQFLAHVVPRGAGTWDNPLGSLSNINIARMELIVNNLFLSPYVQEIFIRRISFSLIRVHLIQPVQMTESDHKFRLNTLKWPTEEIYIGARRRQVIDPSTQARFQDQYDEFNYATEFTAFSSDGNVDRLVRGPAGSTVAVSAAGALVGVGTQFDTVDAATRLQAGDVVQVGGFRATVQAVTSDTAASVFVNPDTAVPATADWAKVVSGRSEVKAVERRSLIDTLALDVHGAMVFSERHISHYNQYLMWHYGKNVLVNSTDPGLAIMPFARFPGVYQPSGHLNMSRVRESFLEVSASTVNSSDASTALTLHVEGRAMNFLLIVDGSAVLRYAT